MSGFDLVAFDLDDTLAPSKSPLPARMAQALRNLLDISQVCVISGGQFSQFETQLLHNLDASETQLERLHIMPTCGTRYVLRRNGQWEDVYARNLTEAERKLALDVVEKEAKRLGLWAEKTWGPILEDRGSQITFSALGQQAPLEEKKQWDSDGQKKALLRGEVAKLLPELEVRSGGSTSIDITRKGIDKAYGIEELAKQTGISIADMIFVGDRLDEAGNDFPVLRLGIAARPVKNWQDTADFIEKYCANPNRTYATIESAS